MAENITLTNISSFTNDTSAVNATANNNAAITAAFQDVLSRSGVSPNQMTSALDMNNNQIINLPTPSTVNSPARLIDVVSNPTIVVPPTGTSGHNVPFLDGNNTWSGTNTYNTTSTFGGSSVFNGSSTFNGTATFSNTTNVPFIQTGSGAVTRTVDAKLKDSVSISATDFGCVGDGVTNNFTNLSNAITAAGGKTLFFPQGNFVNTLTSAFAGFSVAANTVFRGMGKGISILTFTGTGSSFANVFSMSTKHVTFKDMTIVLNGDGTGLQNLILFSLVAGSGQILLENCELVSNCLEGTTIGGTATNGDQVKMTFTSTALAGSPITISSTVSGGQTTAQIASGLATAINANATLTSAGIVATASGSFIGIAQPDTLEPQATLSTSVTGAATETMTYGVSGNTFAFVIGVSASEINDITLLNTDVFGFDWVILKANSTTTINRRWRILGGFFSANINGHVNINSPKGTFERLVVSGTTMGPVGLGTVNGTPISLANVGLAAITGNSIRGTFINNIIHLEEACTGITVSGNVIQGVTSTSLGAGFSGSGIFMTDNNIGTGSFRACVDISITGNTFRQATTNSSGYGIFVNATSVLTQRLTVVGNTFSGFSAGANIIATQFDFIGNTFTSFVGSGTGITVNASSSVGTIANNAINNFATALSGSGTTIQITNNVGYNPVGAQASSTMGASPFTVTAGNSPETHYINQSATNTATIAKNTRSIHTLVNASTFYVVELRPNESYITTWTTTAPTFVRDIH